MQYIYKECPKHGKQAYDIVNVLNGLAGVTIILNCPLCKHEVIIFFSYKTWDEFLHPHRKERNYVQGEW